MKKILVIIFLLFVAIFISSDSNTFIKAQTNSRVRTPESCGQLKFHFLVVRNEMYSANVRSLEVFMEESAFSEENLTQVFRYLESKNTDAKILSINVKTNWKQFSFPDDCMNGTGRSNVPYDPSIFDFYHATYHRSNFSDTGRREFFKYNPELKVEKYKTVFLKSDSK